MSSTSLTSSSPLAVARARALDPNDGKCLLQNIGIEQGASIEPALAMSVAENRTRNLLDKLEWAWLMPKGTLNVESGRNIFFVESSLKSFYDNGAWALLPEESDLDRYLLFPPDPSFVAPRQKFPTGTVEEPCFTYTFVPIGDAMKSVVLSHRGADGHIQKHSYPFTTFPKVTSHIDPKYAVVRLSHAAGGAFVNLNERARLAATYPTLYTVHCICNAWLARLITADEQADQDPIYQGFESDRDVSEVSSNRTPRRRSTVFLPAVPTSLKRRRVSERKTTKRTKLANLNNNDTELNEMVLKWLKACTPPPSDDSEEDSPAEPPITSLKVNDAAFPEPDLDMDSASQAACNDDDCCSNDDQHTSPRRLILPESL